MPLIMMTRRRDNENVGKAERRLIKARVSRGTEHRAVIVLNIRYLLRLNTLRMRMNLFVGRKPLALRYIEDYDESVGNTCHVQKEKVFKDEKHSREKISSQQFVLKKPSPFK